MIYFIQAGDASRPIKIGYARDVAARMATLQTSCPDELRLLAVMDGDREAEVSLHSILAPHRIRGEWFQPAAELLDLIAGLYSGDSAVRQRTLAKRVQRRQRCVVIEASPERVEHYMRLREQVAVQRALRAA